MVRRRRKSTTRRRPRRINGRSGVTGRFTKDCFVYSARAGRLVRKRRRRRRRRTTKKR